MDRNTPNRLEAERWLGIATKLLTARDFLGSKTFAIRARESDPTNEHSDRILAVVETVLAGEKRVNPSQHPDWYTVLQLPRLVRDPELITNHYRRLVVLLSPERNRFPFSDYALQLVMDAWSILSDPSKKWLFDNELAVYLNRAEQERLGSGSNGPGAGHGHVQQPEMSVEVAAAAAGTFQFLMPNVSQQQQQQSQPTVSVPLWPPQQQQQQQVEHEHQQHQQHYSNNNNNAININSNAININSDINNNNQNQLHQIEFMQAQPQQLQQQQVHQQQQFPPQWQMRDPTPTRRVVDVVAPVVAPVVRRVSEMVVPTQPVATMAATRVFDGNFGNVVGSRGGNVNANVNVNVAASTRLFDGNVSVPPAGMTRVFDGNLDLAAAAAAAAAASAKRVFDGNVGNVVNDSVMYNINVNENENNNNSNNNVNVEIPGVENENGIRSNMDNLVNDNDNVNVEAVEDVGGSFWTSCPYCLYIYEFPKVYQECTLRCQNCRRGFHAIVVPNPPPISGIAGNDGDDEKDVKPSFNSWGFFPLGFSTAKWKKNNRMGKSDVASNWVPFSPMFECPAENGGESFQWFEKSDGAAVGPKTTGKLPVSGARIYRIIDEDGFNSDPSDSDSSDQDWRRNPGNEKQKPKKKKRKVHVHKKVSPQGIRTQNQTPSKPVTRTGASPGRPRLGTGYVTTNDIVIGLTASTNKADTRKKLAATLTRNQAKRRVKNMGKLDLNVEFNNDGNEHAPTMSAVNGEEDAIENIGFFEGLDEFFSTMPILNVGEEEKAKPS